MNSIDYQVHEVTSPYYHKSLLSKHCLTIKVLFLYDKCKFKIHIVIELIGQNYNTFKPIKETQV